MGIEILDKFGKILIENVRDESIEIMDKKVSGKIKTSESKVIGELFNGLSNTEKQFVYDVIQKTVDQTIHSLLFILEQREDIDVQVFQDEFKKQISVNIRENSDGLCGELYGEHGWINLFSKQRHNEK